jgi:hypothetical protein
VNKPLPNLSGFAPIEAGRLRLVEGWGVRCSQRILDPIDRRERCQKLKQVCVSLFRWKNVAHSFELDFHNRMSASDRRGPFRIQTNQESGAGSLKKLYCIIQVLFGEAGVLAKFFTGKLIVAGLGISFSVTEFGHGRENSNHVFVHVHRSNGIEGILKVRDAQWPHAETSRTCTFEQRRQL